MDVGFPGETPEDLEETIDVVRKVKFENAFTFLYSKRTVAAEIIAAKHNIYPRFKGIFSVIWKIFQK